MCDEVLNLLSDAVWRCPGQVTDASAQLLDDARRELVNVVNLLVKDRDDQRSEPAMPRTPAAGRAPRRSPQCRPLQRLANTDSGVAMIATISTASTSVMICSKISPATTSPKASSTAR